MTTTDWSKAKRPIPVPDDLSKPFWEAAKQGVLVLQHCQSCGHYQHPPDPTCEECMSVNLKFEPVGSKGTIFSYVIMHYPGDPNFKEVVPYATIIVELDEAKGALIAGNLLGVPNTEVDIGRRVEVVFEKLNDEITLPQFKLAK